MTSNHDDQPRRGGLLLGAGAAILMVACCALLPLLLVGGTLTSVGFIFRNPWVIGVGALLVATALGYALVRRTSPGGDDCCQPDTQDDGSAATPADPPNHT